MTIQPPHNVFTTNLELATLRCIHNVGIQRFNLDELAHMLQRSRTTMFRYFRSRDDMLVWAHGKVVPMLNTAFDVGPADRRSEFEQWWEELLERLRSELGRAFRALRPAVAAKRALDSLERDEVKELPGLRAWIVAAASLGKASTDAIVRTAWQMLLEAAGSAPGSHDERELRELVWSLVAGAPDRADDGDASTWTMLEGPLLSSQVDLMISEPMFELDEAAESIADAEVPGLELAALDAKPVSPASHLVLGEGLSVHEAETTDSEASTLIGECRSQPKRHRWRRSG